MNRVGQECALAAKCRWPSMSWFSLPSFNSLSLNVIDLYITISFHSIPFISVITLLQKVEGQPGFYGSMTTELKVAEPSGWNQKFWSSVAQKEVECPAVPHFQDLSERRFVFLRAIEAVWHHTCRGSCGLSFGAAIKNFIRSSIALRCRFNSICHMQGENMMSF